MQAHYRPSLTQQGARITYSAMIFLLLPISFMRFLFYCWRGKAGYDRKRLSRYGIITQPLTPGGLLIHCASVGEVLAVQNLISTILKSHPLLPITITTNTTTGAMRVKALFKDQVKHVYLPYDLTLLIGSLLAKLKPTMVLINEMELWPNLIHSCWQRHIPVYLINGRMSDKSRKTCTKFPRLFSPMFSKLTGICAQGQRDYDNYLAMNIPPDKVSLSNNIKFDMELAQNEHQEGARLRDKLGLGDRPILLGGSTHEPEEEVLIAAFKQLCLVQPDLLLMIVPRHPQRFEKVVNLCHKSGLSFIKASENKTCQRDTHILLLDQMGLLRPAYALAKIAFVGGSIANKGGHNALEPAAFGVPILMGPHTYNNPAICQTLLDAGALHKVSGAQDILRQCTMWLQDDELRITAGESGKKVLAENGGAIAATLKVLGLA